MDFSSNRICQLLGISLPIIQGGMVWVSGWKLASAVSSAGGLGLIGAGSMKLDVLEHHLQKALKASDRPIGMNVPLLYSESSKQIDLAWQLGVRIFFMSAGSPNLYTKSLKDRGAIVVHVTDCVERALKCQKAGVDAVVLEGFEAGGHNGRDELTTLTLAQKAAQETLDQKLHIPYIMAGGVGSGEAMFALMSLGAEAVQVGTRFAATVESSAHPLFKEAMVKSPEAATFLRMKKTVPVRLLNSPFSEKLAELEASGASSQILLDFLGKGRAKKGILEGDLEEGELEVGQVVNLVSNVQTVAQVMQEFQEGFGRAQKRSLAWLQ